MTADCSSSQRTHHQIHQPPTSQLSGCLAGAATAKRKRATTDQAPKKKKAKEDASVKWTSLQHSGVLFPPGYEPHGVKMLYDKEPVNLMPEQEEVSPLPSVLIRICQRVASSRDVDGWVCMDSKWH